MRSLAMPVAFLLLSVGCDPAGARLPEYELTGAVMGTTFSVKLVSEDEKPDLGSLEAAVLAAMDSVDTAMSTYKKDSELSLFNASKSTDWQPVSAELCETVAMALELGEETDGAFDVTVGPLVNLWGFGPDGMRDTPPSDTEIEAARARVDYRRLHANCEKPALQKASPDVYVDLSGIAKGYAVDKVAETLELRQVDNYLVEIGGEVRMRGHNAESEPWAIAIEKPVTDARAVQTVVHLSDAAMATSGDYRNFFEFEGRRYSHTIDPKTGRPVVHNGAAVTVVDRTAARADGMATALLVLGPERGMAFAGQEDIAAYFLVHDQDNFDAHASPAFSGYLK